MGIRSQNNPNAGYLDKWVATGYDAAGQPTPPPEGIQATGGIINYYPMPGGVIWKSHTFNSTGSFVVSSLSTEPTCPDALDYLIVAGGGGGGGDLSGGGGAGGMTCSVDNSGGSAPGAAENPIQILATGTLTCTVGSGGAGNASNGAGTIGGNSSIDWGTIPNITIGPGNPAGTYTSLGGGGGAGDGAVAPDAGGSGGGASSQQNNGGSNSNQGYPGGNRDPSNTTGASSGGGGGAGSAGHIGNKDKGIGGNGGGGRPSTIAYGPSQPIVYAGGGGGGGGYGGSPSVAPSWGYGGAGGGGHGHITAQPNLGQSNWAGGQPGLENTGGGGGGGGHNGGDGVQR